MGRLGRGSRNCALRKEALRVWGSAGRRWSGECDPCICILAATSQPNNGTYWGSRNVALEDMVRAICHFRTKCSNVMKQGARGRATDLARKEISSVAQGSAEAPEAPPIPNLDTKSLCRKSARVVRRRRGNRGAIFSSQMRWKLSNAAL